MGWYDAYEQADVAYHAAIERRDHCSWTDQHDAFRAGFVAATGEQKATADRAAAIEAMRGRVEYRVSGDDRRAVIKLQWLSLEMDVYQYRQLGNRELWDGPPRVSWPSPSRTTPAQTREFALALEVLAEIAEQWEAEAGEAAQT